MKPVQPPFLGDLETEVMERLWAHGEDDAKSVHNIIGKARGITLNTVQSTLQRLHRKGLLTRAKVSHAYVYAPAVTREQFNRQILGEVVKRVGAGETDAMLAAFVDLVERAGPDQLERLEQMIAERRDRTEKP